MKCKIFVIIGMVGLLAACGQTGKLYLPKDQKQTQQKKQANSQEQSPGNDLTQQPNQQTTSGSSPIS